jgi:hypothetical protein
VEEGEARLAYRVRTAEAADDAALRRAIGITLAHPDHAGRRESYRGAAGRGDILVLERYDRPTHEWHIAGFIECHMRVDDNLSIRDVGTTGEEPQTGVVRYLLDQAFNSFRPVGAQVKIRRDARAWLEIFQSIPGFYPDGEEYRRPHYWSIWSWDRQRAAAAMQPAPPQRPAPRRAPTPPPPSPPRPAPGVRQNGPAPGRPRHARPPRRPGARPNTPR